MRLKADMKDHGLILREVVKTQVTHSLEGVGATAQDLTTATVPS